MTEPILLAVPNFSEGRDATVIGKIQDALVGSPAVKLLDTHTDADHHRTVFTLAGRPGALSEALVAGARRAISEVDLRSHHGAHPRVGALDVAPVVYLRPEDAGAACAEALVLGDLLGDELGLPVFLYGALGAGRTRAEVRRGGTEELVRRIAAGELRPDLGPDTPHPKAGGVLVGARPPLVAFNVELAAPATVEDARLIAAAIREGGSAGLPGVRALGLWLGRRGVAQVSMNVEDHVRTSLADVVSAISAYATPARAELVGLAPRAALDGFPAELPFQSSGAIEDSLAAAGLGG